MPCDHCGSASHPSANYCPFEGKELKDVRVAPAGLSDKETDRQLKWYEKAKAEGHQPWGTSVDHKTGYLQSEMAMAIADRTGRPYDAANMASSVYPETQVKELSQEQKDRARQEAT